MQPNKFPVLQSIEDALPDDEEKEEDNNQTYTKTNTNDDPRPKSYANKYY